MLTVEIWSSNRGLDHTVQEVMLKVEVRCHMTLRRIIENNDTMLQVRKGKRKKNQQRYVGVTGHSEERREGRDVPVHGYTDRSRIS